MIRIILSDIKYRIDVYHLVKAFFPDKSIEFIHDKELVKGDTNLLKIDFRAKKIIIHYIYQKAGEQEDILRSIEISSKINTRSQYKNSMKRLLYKILHESSGTSLPWGILTGTRPTKLVYEMLEQGYDDKDIVNHMQEEFLCSDDRIKLSLQIAKREINLLKEIDHKNGYSLYIGIPFCPSTCSYCSFTSYSIEKYSEDVEKYLKSLEKEIIFAARSLSKSALKTVYIGGGTPTTLSASQLDWLINILKQHFDFSQVKEFSVEAGRPDSINKEKLWVLKKHGVNRISINPQSMKQETLDLIGRKHTVDQVREAFRLARETGHDNINMDLIIGLPGESLKDIKDTLYEISKLNPDSLTVHALAIKRAARLKKEKEHYHESGFDHVSKMMEYTFAYAKEHDYLPYYLYRQKNIADNLENIGYARYGKEGLYNILIMEEQQTIIGLGAGAISKFVFYDEKRIERTYNVKAVGDYISRTDEMIQRKQKFLKSLGGSQ